MAPGVRIERAALRKPHDSSYEAAGSALFSY